jgi:hypothetical protein
LIRREKKKNKFSFQVKVFYFASKKIKKKQEMGQVGPEEELEGDGGFFGFGEKPELPVEVVLAVLGLLSGSDLVRAEAVCRRWRTFLSSASPLGSTLWRTVPISFSPHFFNSKDINK